jgi:hypothetical protein
VLADPDNCRLPAPLIWAGCLSLAGVPFVGLLGLNLLLGVLALVFGWTVPRWLLWTDGIVLGLLGGTGWRLLFVLIGKSK